MMLNYMEIWK